MKKLLNTVLLFIVTILFITGCGNDMATPTAKVEEFLGKYQKMDSEVLTQLDNVIAEDSSMNDEQKKEYRSLLEKQYQNLSYKIKDETITDDTATVDVEIEVYDYATSIRKSKDYYKEHQDEFTKTKETIDEDNPLDNDGANTTDTPTDDNNDNDNDNENESESDGLLEEASEFIDYKIKQLKNVTDKVKYDITFNLTKKDGKWYLEDISDMDRQKIHGLYEE